MLIDGCYYVVTSIIAALVNDNQWISISCLQFLRFHSWSISVLWHRFSPETPGRWLGTGKILPVSWGSKGYNGFCSAKVSGHGWYAETLMETNTQVQGNSWKLYDIYIIYMYIYWWIMYPYHKFCKTHIMLVESMLNLCKNWYNVLVLTPRHAMWIDLGWPGCATTNDKDNPHPPGRSPTAMVMAPGTRRCQRFQCEGGRSKQPSAVLVLSDRRAEAVPKNQHGGGSRDLDK